MPCFFVGENDVPQSVAEKLTAEVERHVCRLGVTDFVVGQNGTFDRMAAEAVARVRERYPEVTLGVLIAYHPAESAARISVDCDYTVYPPGMEYIPKRLAVVRANRYMIENSERLIAYAWKQGSDARKLLEYAYERKGLVVTRLRGD